MTIKEHAKTDAGNRDLIIPSTALITLNQILELNPSGMYLFEHYNKRIRGNTFNKRLSAICDKLQIPHRTMHKIRKTYGTTLIDGDVDEGFITEQMGHSDISTTKKLYYFSNKTMENKEKQIENVLALRGDIPQNADFPLPNQYKHASELIYDIKSQGDFCIGGACYPEGHPESQTLEEDLIHLKEKVDAGCEFLTTQMFFDNNILYNFMYKALKHGIDVPVVAGIMPITNANQVKRSIALSGSLVPRRFLAIVDRFGSDPAAMKQAGIAYATDQIIDLIANGVNHVHIYTMNKPDVAGAILENLSDIYVRD